MPCNQGKAVKRHYFNRKFLIEAAVVAHAKRAISQTKSYQDIKITCWKKGGSVKAKDHLVRFY